MSMNVLILESVGSCIDEGGNVYPLWENGTPDTENPIHFSECTQEWYDGLSKDDYSAFLEWHMKHNLSIYDFFNTNFSIYKESK